MLTFRYAHFKTKYFSFLSNVQEVKAFAVILNANTALHGQVLWQCILLLGHNHWQWRIAVLKYFLPLCYYIVQ